ncbi:MAG TPA: TetR/AcrR family transcriptional regulator [Terriglobales bacterium]
MRRCLRAFVEAGTLEVSLDQLAARVKISKRMLIHYFGGREQIEHGAMAVLEDQLRAQFSPAAFPGGIAPEKVIMMLWERTIARESRGVLLLVMDLSRRAWSGSKRARAFYDEQQRLWVELLLKFIPNRQTIEEILQVFQGAVFAYLITGNAEPGRRALQNAVARWQSRPAKIKRLAPEDQGRL